MAFTTEVKDELARVTPSRRCCRMAELSALFHLEGALHLSGPHRLSLHTESENAAVARKMFSYLREIFIVSPELRVEKAPRLRGHNCYCLYLEGGERSTQIINELGLLDDSLRPVLGIPARITRRYCCGIAYLRGAFMGGGYVSRPEQPAHLEINVQHSEMAEGLRDLASRYGIEMNVARKKSLCSVYSKSRSDQADLLALLGAYDAVLRLQSDAVVRELRERVNRRVNSETANLERTVNAAQRQLHDIRVVAEGPGLAGLPPALREIAEIRLSHPEASLQELGEYLQPPLSKSAVYHRLLRIRRIASGTS
ncbi:MAG: DNA-binding protein WhiA [Actinomycetota bacterium]|nr:DNA-binding protein WhiA [Actinomycetota bacterium]MDD5665775.1 DNA-binding protein WhiA [Actinomycetota bacterium]